MSGKRKRFGFAAGVAVVLGCILPSFSSTGGGVLQEEAGRVLKLHEVFRIADVQADYYLKSPDLMQVAPDGSLFVVDDEQLLKFDKNGQFVKNLYKKGQGPGELEGISDLFISQDTLFVLQGRPTKIMLMNFDGELIREFKLESSIYRLCAVHDGTYVTAQYGPPRMDKVGDEAKIVDVSWTLGYISDDQTVNELELEFPVRWFAKRILGGKALIASHIAEFRAEPFLDKYLVICHAEDYKLRLFDLDQKRIVKDFGRDYRRVRFKQQDDSGQIEIRPGVSRFVPPVRHLNDVQKLFIREDLIWVMTSTIESGKGVLFDVFNEQGESVDFFYLPLQESVIADALEDLPICFYEDSVYIVEYDEDDLPSVVKYRIEAQH